MKPRTKYQKKIHELHLTLSKVKQSIIDWGYDKIFVKYNYRNKTNNSCMICGHQWPVKEDGSVCPSCKSKLTFKDTKDRTYNTDEYYAVVTTVKEYQVVRYFKLFVRAKAGNKISKSFYEAGQVWLDFNKNERIIYTSKVNAYNGNLCPGTLEQRNNAYWIMNVYPYAVYKHMKVLPIIKRNGFKYTTCNCKPESLFCNLVYDFKYETLYKAKQYMLVDYFTGRESDLNKHWPAIKIVNRYKYKITNMKMYADYLDMLLRLNKDRSNPTIVCPKNLKIAHDHVMNLLQAKRDKESRRWAREREEERRLREKKRLENLEKDKEKYIKTKAFYFNNIIEDKDLQLQIVPLKSVEEFQIEGKKLKHCIYVNEYYNRKNSLMLSARRKNIPIETIELSMDKKEIEQTGGYKNKESKYHDEIVELINNNINKILKKRKSNERTKRKIGESQQV